MFRKKARIDIIDSPRVEEITNMYISIHIAASIKRRLEIVVAPILALSHLDYD